MFFVNYLLEMLQGFNLLFYGFGSKRILLNKLATNYCATKGHVVVANGFLPNFNIKDLVLSIELNVPEVISVSLVSSGLEAQARRIHDFWSDASKFSLTDKAARKPLFVIIHNINAPALRTSRAKSLLSLLALGTHIHIVASIDHINALLLWSRSDMSARKHDPFDVDMEERSSTHSFTWLWHELTTLRPYDAELSSADRSSFAGASSAALQRRLGASGREKVAMTESVAQHILASVTDMARRLFVLLSTKQVESMEEDGEKGRAATKGQITQYALGYDSLFAAARSGSVAINDTAMRALLGEFRDHVLVVSSGAVPGSEGGGERLYIPLSFNVLKAVLDHVGRNL